MGLTWLETTGDRSGGRAADSQGPLMVCTAAGPVLLQAQLPLTTIVPGLAGRA